MKRNRFSEEQIIGISKEHQAGISVSDLRSKHGVSDASIYKWKAKFGGMDVSEAKKPRGLEEENAKSAIATSPTARCFQVIRFSRSARPIDGSISV